MTGKIFFAFFADVSVMFIFVYFFNKWRPFMHYIEKRQCFCWECFIPFAVTTLMVMQYPFELAQGYQSDLRAVPIAMAGYLGGPATGLLTALLMIAVRIVDSGMVIKPLAVYPFIGITAYLLRRTLPWPAFSLRNMFVLAVMINIYLNFGGLFLPSVVQVQFFAPSLIAVKAGLIFAGLSVLAIALRMQVEDMHRMVVLNERASQDSLTGLLNHGAFVRKAENALLWGTSPGILMIIDLDDFKQINDACGHLTGDNVLMFMAQVFKENLRSQDVVGRLGGEEFGVLLQNTDLNQAMAIARRIQERAKQYSDLENCLSGRELTMSIGVIAYRPGPNCMFNKIFQQADEALYRAKRQGRNRIEIFNDRDL